MAKPCVKDLVLVNKLGLHARAAAAFAKEANNYKCDITVIKNGIEVNGKSVLGLLMLAMPNGTSFQLKTDGVDADKAIDGMAELIANRFGEES